ncbi:hypothetical protein BGW80DRAFT_1287025 [Lactifluus volemus]|nr:hypothetical protein BGW80DRAFT_1287025 [Lactifluus volemus]
MRSCVFNNIKRDQPVLFFVAFLDIVAAIGWSVRLDNKGFCTNRSDGTATCHTKLFVVALCLSWASFIVAFCGGVRADHKEDPPLPVHISRRREISPPVAVTIAGEYGLRDDPKHIPIIFPA